MQSHTFAPRKVLLPYGASVVLLCLIACGGNETTNSPATVSSIKPDSSIAYPLSDSAEKADTNKYANQVGILRWLDYRQIDRIPYQDLFRLPNFRHGARDEYTETRVTPPLDILIIIDDSGSMEGEQRNLAARMDPLLTYVQGADWQIHVVTTSKSCPAKTIKKGDPDTNTAFAAAINAGTTGDFNERGVKMARESLETPCAGVSWLRPNSTLAILFVSDEDNCGQQGGCTSEGAWENSSYLYDYLAQIRKPGETARVYGILWHPTQAICSGASTMGADYADLITRTQGIWGSICEADYTPILLAISRDASSLLPPTVSLQEIPASGQVVVTVSGRVLAASEYRITGRNLYLLQPIALGERVVVDYEYDGVYSRDLPLGHPAAPDSVQIESRGSRLPLADYSYDPSTTKVTLLGALLPLQELKVLYRENKPLKTVFFAGPVADPTAVHCFLNDGTEIYGFTYDPVQQAIVFTVPPVELQLFKCSLAR